METLWRRMAATLELWSRVALEFAGYPMVECPMPPEVSIVTGDQAVEALRRELVYRTAAVMNGALPRCCSTWWATLSSSLTRARSASLPAPVTGSSPSQSATRGREYRLLNNHGSSRNFIR